MVINFKKHWKSYLITFIVSLVIGVLAFIFVFLSHDMVFIDAVDGVTLAMVILFGVGGLMFVGYEGFFDIFAYGFKQMGDALFRKKANEHNDFAAYKEDKTTQRTERPKLFLSFLVSGTLFLIAMIVLRIILFTL